MWLIQIGEDLWIDAKKITSVWKSRTKWKLTIIGESTETIVSEGFEYSFLNHLNQLNENISQVE